MGNTHMHAGQAAFDTFVSLGIRAFAITNYHPAEPTCPLDEHFPTVPPDALCIPSSEVYGVANSSAHLVSLATVYTTGEAGAGTQWWETIDDILADLVWPDAGGVVVAHPNYSRLTIDEVVGFLDHDERVIGLEAFNFLVQTNPNYDPEQQASAIPVWDEILSTGRKCFGFFATDHLLQPDAQGRTMLLVPASTAEECARAWREGRFYGALHGIGLALIGFTADPATTRQVTVNTDSADEICMIVDGAVVDTEAGPSATFTVPGGALYARFEAENEADTIYTQPIMFAR